MLQAIQNRHSVRQYTDKKISQELQNTLNKFINQANQQSGLHLEAFYNEPDAFNTFMAHYGKFENVTNYVVLAGKKNMDEKIGYFGEKIVLKAQELGLNTCWVALTYGKKRTKISLKKGEKIYCTLALGYGKTQGIAHKVKTPQQVSNVCETTPKWFSDGVNASLLAPTAMNQQKFKFLYKDGKVIAKAGTGFYTKVDLGIAKYHFEIGANKSVDWQ